MSVVMGVLLNRIAPKVIARAKEADRMDILDVVELRVDLPDENLAKGARGVIIAVFSDPERAYEVEFCNDQGETIAEIALRPELLLVVTTEI